MNIRDILSDMNGDNRKNKYNMHMYAIVFSAVLLAVILLAVFYQTKKAFSVLPKQQEEKYKNHYAFISVDKNDDFYYYVFQAAKAAGEQQGDWVEYFGKDLATVYSREQLLEIAIASNVDGIFLQADESKEIASLINAAVNKGIPVITMGSDCTASTRQSYVGVNNYSLGQQYGQQIISMGKKGEVDVLVLMNPNSADTSQNIVYAAIKEQLENSDDAEYELNTMVISNDSTFSAEESIRDTIIKGNKAPDILVCLNERNTSAAYQALVDYNRVGSIEIVGYHKNSSIIDGIAQNNIYASFEVDTNQMGEDLIYAIDEYKEYGYVNEYLPIDVRIINSENVEGYLDEME